jgi:hypothetical protein
LRNRDTDNKYCRTKINIKTEEEKREGKIVVKKEWEDKNREGKESYGQKRQGIKQAGKRKVIKGEEGKPERRGRKRRQKEGKAEK